MIKRYAIMMTYEVSDAEKMQAERAILFFNNAIKMLDFASDHLNIMKTPFENNPDMSPEEVMKARAALRRFRDKCVDNFNEFKVVAFKCVNVMQVFGSDTQTVKLMKSFVSSVNNLEDDVNKFVEIFEDLESKTFSKDIVDNITNIQKCSEEIEEIIEDRIKNHIQTNILARSWVDSVSNDLQMKVEKKTPLILELFNDRQDQLNDIIKERSTLGNP